MKNIIISLVVFLALGTTTLVYTFKQGIKDKIVKALTVGDVEALAESFAADIQLTLYEEDFLENKNQVKTEIQNFFDKHPPQRFKVRHEGGKEHKKISFMIGVLHCSKETFRVTLTIEDDLIRSITIEPEIPFG